VVTGGINYANTFDGTTCASPGAAATATASAATTTSKPTARRPGRLRQRLRRQRELGALLQHFRAKKAIDSITGDISYATGPFVASIGYAYASAEKGQTACPRPSPTARI